MSHSEIFRCPVCSSDFKALLTKEEQVCLECGFEVVQSHNVPLLFKDQRTIQNLLKERSESASRAWYVDGHIQQLAGPYRHHMRKRFIFLQQLLARLTSERGLLRCLDAGCGDGVNLPLLSQFVSELYACDYNPLRLSRAVASNSQNFLFGSDLTNLPIQTEVLDLIFCNHVLEHIPEDHQVLAEFYRILRKGGCCILGVPNEGAAFWQIAYRLEPWTVAATDHKHFYTAETIAARCNQTGFVVERIHAMGWGVPHWSLDSLIRRVKLLDDIFEILGRAFFPGQASSLYLLLRK